VNCSRVYSLPDRRRPILHSDAVDLQRSALRLQPRSEALLSLSSTTSEEKEMEPRIEVVAGIFARYEQPIRGRDFGRVTSSVWNFPCPVPDVPRAGKELNAPTKPSVSRQDNCCCCFFSLAYEFLSADYKIWNTNGEALFAFPPPK